MDLEGLKHPVVISVSYIEPKHVFGLLGNEDFLFLGGSGRYQMLALEHERVSWQSFLAIRPEDHFELHKFPFFHLGFIGVMPYRELDSRQQEGSVFKVSASLVWDTTTRRCYLVYSRNLQQSKWQRVIALVETLKNASLRRDGAIPVVPKPVQLELTALHSDQNYLHQVDEAIEDIHSGRYYQINILRYFKIPGLLTDEILFSRFNFNGGPFSAFFQWNNQRLVSFSPERFVRIEEREKKLNIRMQPIKGSLKRQGCDDTERQQLLSSVKDRAELSIIIDLARNDIQSVARAGTVKVEDEARIDSFPTIHHLVADITGELRRGLSFADLFDGLLPSASITGAPKREVRAAIKQAERRPRNYFMGNIFYWDPGSSLFDSSVLIRTLHGQRVKSSWEYSYAAGSGIVANSIAASELNEVHCKTRVITEGARVE